ncbi:MAG: hypothetical protein Q9225_004809, partial [Loekoesia sp. 1 TL-2023]
VMERKLVKGAAHITGGGLVENVPRVLPKHLTAEIEASSWEVPAVFRWLKKAGAQPKEEMARVFNMGVGMVLIVGEENVRAATEILEGEGERVLEIGKLVERKGDEQGCVIRNWEMWDEKSKES